MFKQVRYFLFLMLWVEGTFLIKYHIALSFVLDIHHIAAVAYPTYNDNNENNSNYPYLFTSKCDERENQ